MGDRSATDSWGNLDLRGRVIDVPLNLSGARVTGAVDLTGAELGGALRITIWPDASKAQNSIAAVSADGSTVCVLIRRLNSSCRRSIALVVRAPNPTLACRDVDVFLSNGVEAAPTTLYALSANIAAASTAAAAGGPVLTVDVYDAPGDCILRGTDNMQMRFASGLPHASICRGNVPVGPSQLSTWSNAATRGAPRPTLRPRLDATAAWSWPGFLPNTSRFLSCVASNRPRGPDPHSNGPSCLKNETTSAMINSMLPLPGLSPVSGKSVVATFDGGLLSSDGGVLSTPPGRAALTR